MTPESYLARHLISWLRYTRIILPIPIYTICHISLHREIFLFCKNPSHSERIRKGGVFLQFREGYDRIERYSIRLMSERSHTQFEHSRKAITPEEQRGLDFADKAKRVIDKTIRKVDILAKSMSIRFDTIGSRNQMNKEIYQVLDDPQIPQIAKDKFLTDIELNTSFFTSEITKEKVTAYTKQRDEDSFGMTSQLWETLEQNFARMVYVNFTAYIQGASTWLKSFSAEKNTLWGVSYLKKELSNLDRGIAVVDSRYWLSLMDILERLKKRAVAGRLDLTREGIYKEMSNGLIEQLRIKNPDNTLLANLHNSLNSQQGFDIKRMRDTDVVVKLNTGWDVRVSFKKLLAEYQSHIVNWYGIEHEARDAQAIALSDGVSSKVKSVLWMNQLRSEFDHISVAATRERMQHSSIADIVIMAKHLSQLTPGFGDALWVYMDGRDANSWVSSIDAKLLSMNERALWGVFAVLGLAWVWVIGNRIRKANKMIELIASLREAMRWFPAKLDACITSGKALTPWAIDLFGQLSKMIWGKIGEEIRESMDRYMSNTWLQMHFISPWSKKVRNAAEWVKWIKEYRNGTSLDVQLWGQIELKIISRADGGYLIQVPWYKTSLREWNHVDDIQSTNGIALKQWEILEVWRWDEAQTWHMRLSIPDIEWTDSVSRKHMMVRIWDDWELRIQDLSSRNWTHVKIATEKNTEPVRLKNTESVSSTLDKLSSQLDGLGNNIWVVFKELKSLIKLPNIRIWGIEGRIDSLIHILLSEVKNISSSTRDNIIDWVFKLRKTLNIKKSPVNAIPWSIEKISINIEWDAWKITRLNPWQYEVEKLGFSQYMINWKEWKKSLYKIFTLDEIIKNNPTLLYSQLWWLTDVFKHSSNSAKKIMESGVLYSPKFIATIWEREFLVTKKIKSDGRDIVVWYTLINGKYEPRLFYFSQSGWNWHCAPWVDKDADGFYFSKWANWNNGWYTKSTVVTDEISHLLASLPLWGTTESEWFMELWMNSTGRVQSGDFAKHTQFDWFKNRRIYTVWSWRFTDVRAMSEVNNMRIDSGFDISFSWGFTYWPSIEHQYLWNVETYIWRTKWNWQDVEVIFARAKNNEPNQFWVEDIKIAWDINSFGLPNIVVNWWLLTTKPIEYDDQIPVFMRNLWLQKYGPHYYDIRQFLQNNPLIREFKRQNNMVTPS